MSVTIPPPKPSYWNEEAKVIETPEAQWIESFWKGFHACFGACFFLFLVSLAVGLLYILIKNW